MLTSRDGFEGSAGVPAFSFLAVLLELPLAGFTRAAWALLWTGCGAELVGESTGADITEVEHVR